MINVKKQLSSSFPTPDLWAWEGRCNSCREVELYFVERPTQSSIGPLVPIFFPDGKYATVSQVEGCSHCGSTELSVSTDYVQVPNAVARTIAEFKLKQSVGSSIMGTSSHVY